MNVEEIFGANRSLPWAMMKERLPKKVFQEVKTDHGLTAESLSLATADVVAKAMKDWAVENGATHYTHWFQPLTGITAEKHDAFITHPDEHGKMLMEFSGKELIKGEPDASSFPSGGLRATFEARGYTAWDCTSPGIPERRCGRRDPVHSHCILFLQGRGAGQENAAASFHGGTRASRHCVLSACLATQRQPRSPLPSARSRSTSWLTVSKYLQRKDLIYTGRTLFGAPAPKGQEMEDHYFGTIKERVGRLHEGPEH